MIATVSNSGSTATSSLPPSHYTVVLSKSTYHFHANQADVGRIAQNMRVILVQAMLLGAKRFENEGLVFNRHNRERGGVYGQTNHVYYTIFAAFRIEISEGLDKFKALGLKYGIEVIVQSETISRFTTNEHGGTIPQCIRYFPNNGGRVRVDLGME